MIAFIDAPRARCGVEPICRVLPIAASPSHTHAAGCADPGKLPARARRDVTLRTKIRRVSEATFRVYGVRKVWRPLLREGIAVARCTVARLMRMRGLRGIGRGKPVRTTISNAAAPCPLDRVKRPFKAPRPNALWLSDFTSVATCAGFLSVAFLIDVLARRLVGWRACRTAHPGVVLDALEQARHERRPVRGGGLVHHRDRGVPYLLIKYTERRAAAGIEPSVGSLGDSGACPRAGKAEPAG
jgi:transposase InsO family protein